MEHSFQGVEHHKGQEVVGRYKDQVEVDHCKDWVGAMLGNRMLWLALQLPLLLL